MLSQDESMDLFDAIKSAMEEDNDAIFLLDEITYAYQPEKEINEISIQLSEKPCKNTKIVFTGSQSVALVIPLPNTIPLISVKLEQPLNR